MANDARVVDATAVRLFVEMFHREGRATCAYPDGENVSAIVEHLTRSNKFRPRYSIDQAWELIQLAHKSGKIGSYLCEDGVEPKIASIHVVRSAEEAHNTHVASSLADSKPVDLIIQVINNIKEQRRDEAFNVALQLLEKNLGTITHDRLRQELLSQRCCVQSELNGMMRSIGKRLRTASYTVKGKGTNAVYVQSKNIVASGDSYGVDIDDDNAQVWPVSYHLYLGEAANIRVLLRDGNHAVYDLSSSIMVSPEPIDGLLVKLTISPVEAVQLIDGAGIPLDAQIDLRGSRTIYIY